MTAQGHSQAFRTRVHMCARDFSSAFSGGPSLLVSSRLSSPGSAMPNFGAPTIFATVTSSDVYLARDTGIPPVDDFVEISQLPVDLLAIVATKEDAPHLQSLWTERGLERPPVIIAESAVEAVGPILARMNAELTAVLARCAELQRGLVVTRAEFEETRVAMHGLMRTLSRRYATKMNLVASTSPSSVRTAMLDAHGELQQSYPVGTESLTCVALHIASADLDANAMLKVLLIGAESSRVLGEWRVPSKAVKVGWNTFDLPVPVAAVRETVTLSLAVGGAAGNSISFSLAEAQTGDQESLLAIRVWTADPGGRFPHVNHWVWNSLGETYLPAGVVSLATADIFGRLSEHGSIEAFGEADDTTSRTYLLRGGPSALSLSDLSVLNVEGVCVELLSGLGDLRGTRFNLLAQSPQYCLTTGWRSFGALAQPLRLGLSFPAGLPSIVDLCLRIDDGERAPDDFATVELRRMEIISGKRSEVDLGSNGGRFDIESLPRSQRSPATSRFARLKAQGYNETEKYALFDVAIGDLEFDGRVESAVKFKLSMAKGRLSLEFRQGANWPEMFKEWPGRQEDRFGKVFYVVLSNDGVAPVGELTAISDVALIAALCRLMPTIVATSLRMLPNAANQSPAWLSAAREFAAAAEQTFQRKTV